MEPFRHDRKSPELQSGVLTISTTVPFLKVLRNSYNRIGGIISPNIMSTTMTLTGQAVCLNFHLTRFWPPWEERDSNPQSRMRVDLQSTRLPITGYPPNIFNNLNSTGLEPVRPDLTQVVRFDRRPRVAFHNGSQLEISHFLP